MSSKNETEEILRKFNEAMRALPMSYLEPPLAEIIDLEEARKDKVLSPNYYKFPGGVEVREISSYLSSNGGQALQYIARSTRLDGNNKGDPVENLRKAVKFIEWEIERLENDE